MNYDPNNRPFYAKGVFPIIEIMKSSAHLNNFFS